MTKTREVYIQNAITDIADGVYPTILCAAAAWSVPRSSLGNRLYGMPRSTSWPRKSTTP